MFRNSVFVMFVIMTFAVNGQEVSSSISNKRGCWSAFDLTVKYLSDSLVFVNAPKQLPHYLDNYILDWHNKNSLKGCVSEDEIISLRKAIIDRVSSEVILNWIIESKDTSYDKKYDPIALQKVIKYDLFNTFPEIPYMQFSWRDLAKNRLTEIKERKKVISK